MSEVVTLLKIADDIDIAIATLKTKSDPKTYTGQEAERMHRLLHIDLDVMEVECHGDGTNWKPGDDRVVGLRVWPDLSILRRLRTRYVKYAKAAGWPGHS